MPMTARTIRLLHVEDDVVQQRLLAQFLKKLPDLAFDIRAVTGEKDALQAFAPGKFDLVILDYQLEEGDGLALLRQIRTRDPMIPIIAISGVATKEIAVELVRAGADDYIEKQEPMGDRLTNSVTSAVKRADTVRQRSDQHRSLPLNLEREVLEACQRYGSQSGLQTLNDLNQLESALRRDAVTLRQLERLFAKTQAALTESGLFQDVPPERLLRPFMLELLVRLFGEANVSPSR